MGGELQLASCVVYGQSQRGSGTLDKQSEVEYSAMNGESQVGCG